MQPKCRSRARAPRRSPTTSRARDTGSSKANSFRRLPCASVIHFHARRPHAPEHLERIRQVSSVIAFQIIRHAVQIKLAAETDVDAFAMYQVAHVSDRVTRNRKDRVVVRLIED